MPINACRIRTQTTLLFLRKYLEYAHKIQKNTSNTHIKYVKDLGYISAEYLKYVEYSTVCKISYRLLKF